MSLNKKQLVTAIIDPDGSIVGISEGDVTGCILAWEQAVKKTGKYIPQLQKLGYKIREGVFLANK